ncbi:hypothetical protein [Kitasatospora sp. NPDC050543]|uniref:hypothetical protein n=1 Tax=Kitasatospora sp. NPDC050543 TaxID=3364054 RepID=UPI0037ADF145
MHRSKRFVSAAAALAAVLTAACTATGSTTPTDNYATGPWALDQVTGAPASSLLHASVDAPPAKGQAKILGLVEVAGVNIALTLRGNSCEAYILSTSLAEPMTTGPTGFGAQRPARGTPSSDEHQSYPGTVLSGTYTQASGTTSPYFDYLSLGCSEKSMSVKVEGVPSDAQAVAIGDSTRVWRQGRDLLVTVGQPEGLRPR